MWSPERGAEGFLTSAGSTLLSTSEEWAMAPSWFAFSAVAAVSASSRARVPRGLERSAASIWTLKAFRNSSTLRMCLSARVRAT